MNTVHEKITKPDNVAYGTLFVQESESTYVLYVCMIQNYFQFTYYFVFIYKFHEHSNYRKFTLFVQMLYLMLIYTEFM